LRQERVATNLAIEFSRRGGFHSSQITASTFRLSIQS
jgi:hypothetical protein